MNLNISRGVIRNKIVKTPAVFSYYQCNLIKIFRSVTGCQSVSLLRLKVKFDINKTFKRIIIIQKC